MVFLSTFSATSVFEWWSLSLEPIAFITLVLLLAYKIFLTCGFKQFFINYKLEIALVLAYQLVSLFTLWSNLASYESHAHAIRFGLHFIVLSASVPIALWLFTLPGATNRLSLSTYTWSTKLVWLWFLAIALLTVWQVADYQSAKVLSRFFVGSEIWPEENINAIFKINTDLGTILSLSLICFLTLIKVRFATLGRPMLLLLAILSVAVFAAGIATGSRNFFLTFFVGFMVLTLISIKGDKSFRFGFALLFLFLVGMHLVVLASPYALLKFSSVLPYIGVLSVGEVLGLADLMPNLDEQAFAGRLEIWTSAVGVIQANPFLGVSNGVARGLINPIAGGNSHNFILQVLLDTGLVGFAIISALVVTVVIRLKAAGKLLILAPLLFMLLTALSFDYYLDHSLPWILTISYLLAILVRQDEVVTRPTSATALSTPKNLHTKAHHWVFVAVVVLGLLLATKLVWSYVGKNQSNQQLPIGERLINITGTLTPSHNDLIFVDDRFSFTQEQLRVNGGWRFNDFDLTHYGLAGLCHYAVPQSAFVLALDKQLLADAEQQINKYYVHDSRHIAGEPGFATIMSEDVECDGFRYDKVTQMQSTDWFSNRFDNKHPADKNRWPLWAYITLTSKIFMAEKGSYQLSFFAEGRFVEEDLPQLEVEVYRLNDKQKINSEILDIAQRQTYQFDFVVEQAQPLFFKVSFINDLLDDHNKAIFINPETLKVVQTD